MLFLNVLIAVGNCNYEMGEWRRTILTPVYFEKTSILFGKFIFTFTLGLKFLNQQPTIVSFAKILYVEKLFCYAIRA